MPPQAGRGLLVQNGFRAGRASRRLCGGDGRGRLLFAGGPCFDSALCRGEATTPAASLTDSLPIPRRKKRKEPVHPEGRGPPCCRRGVGFPARGGRGGGCLSNAASQPRGPAPPGPVPLFILRRLLDRVQRSGSQPPRRC